MSAAALMEAIGLVYNSSIQEIICLKRSYCLACSRVRRYLQAIHATKGAALKAAYNKVAELALADLSTLEVPSGGPPIPYLTVEKRFHYAAAACNPNSRSLSKNRITVKKYLSKVHNTGPRPGKTPLQQTDIRWVCMQSLTENHQRRFFVVQGSSGWDVPLEEGQLDTLHANADEIYPISDMQALSSLLEDQYTTSQQRLSSDT